MNIIKLWLHVKGCYYKPDEVGRCKQNGGGGITVEYRY